MLAAGELGAESDSGTRRSRVPISVLRLDPFHKRVGISMESYSHQKYYSEWNLSDFGCCSKRVEDADASRVGWVIKGLMSLWGSLELIHCGEFS